MLRLSGGTYFLLLQRSPDLKSHFIDCFHRFEEALGSWEAGARVSPIFAVDNSAPPTLGNLKTSWVVFFGPLFPGDFALPPSDRTFLTLGLFNFVVFFSVEAEKDALLDTLRQRQVRWEEWRLSGNRLDSVNCAPSDTKAARIAKKYLKPIRGQVPALRETLREYVALFATSVGRAGLFGGRFKPDLIRFNEGLRMILASPDVHPASRQRLLVLTNAALSRQSSQTFAGTSPILETECHFWSHSLLGIGIASLALLEIRSFLERALARARLVDRLVRLKEVPSVTKDLESLHASDEFWDRDHLFIYDSQKDILPIDSEPDADVLPLITCFSGRDGFRSTEVSLSAPLEVLSGCNTAEWTPLTLTHEFSHQVIDGLLGQLLPDPSDAQTLDQVIELLETQKYPNLFMQIRVLLCFALWRMDKRAEQTIGRQELGLIIRTHWSSLNEILTHCFDFLYFYKRDAKAYIRSVWASWGVIPNISLRVSQYIVRCLCALHTQNLTREQGTSVSLEQLRLHLQETMDSHQDALYVREALSELDREPEYYKTSLSEREILVKIVRYIFYNSPVERLLFDKSIVTSGERGGYTHQVLQFSQERIDNPLRFIESYARDDAPDQARSLWMLLQLAFGEVQ